MKQIFFIVTLIIFSNINANSIEALKFDNNSQKSLYHQLVKEIRCLVCQNQNIADSNADLAKDLRKLTYKMVLEGKSKKFHPVLSLEIRYKGTFAPWPQFIGGMTDSFVSLIKNADSSVAKKVWADCE